LAEQTLTNFKYVSDHVEISRRRENLTWAHHQEVAALEPTEQKLWLDKAEKGNGDSPWKVKELRRAIKDSKPSDYPPWKGQQCSWRDMRKIKHILANMDKLKGEYQALMKCSKRQTKESWENAIKVMDHCQISGTDNKYKHLQPSHAVEMLRRRTNLSWSHRQDSQRLAAPRTGCGCED